MLNGVGCLLIHCLPLVVSHAGLGGNGCHHRSCPTPATEYWTKSAPSPVSGSRSRASTDRIATIEDGARVPFCMRIRWPRLIPTTAARLVRDHREARRAARSRVNRWNPQKASARSFQLAHIATYALAEFSNLTAHSCRMFSSPTLMRRVPCGTRLGRGGCSTLRRRWIFEPSFGQTDVKSVEKPWSAFETG
jgi:hypothetical protein